MHVHERKSCHYACTGVQLLNFPKFSRAEDSVLILLSPGNEEVTADHMLQASSFGKGIRQIDVEGSESGRCRHMT